MRINKILVIGGSFPPPLTGGSVQYIFNLLTHLENYYISILTASCTKDDEKFDKKSPFHIIRTKYIRQVLDPRHRNLFRRTIDFLFSTILVFIQFWKIKPQIIYLTDYSLLCVGLLLIKIFSSTKIVMFTYAEEITQYSKNKIHRFFLKLILKSSDTIIVVSDYTYSVIKEIHPVPQQKVLKIIPSISHEKIESVPSVIHNLKNDICFEAENFILLTVGRLEERKGHLFVLDAVEKLITKGYQIKYIIIGGGPMDKTIQDKLVSLNLKRSVFMLGRVSDSILSASYDIADVFIMPNIELSNGDTEGCPTVFLEAASHGVPSIGGNAGGVSDAILDKETGYIVDPKDSDCMVYVLEKLILDKEHRLCLGNNARKYAANFTPMNQAKILMNLNNKLSNNN